MQSVSYMSRWNNAETGLKWFLLQRSRLHTGVFCVAHCSQLPRTAAVDEQPSAEKSDSPGLAVKRQLTGILVLMRKFVNHGRTQANRLMKGLAYLSAVMYKTSHLTLI